MNYITHFHSLQQGNELSSSIPFQQDQNTIHLVDVDLPCSDNKDDEGCSKEGSKKKKKMGHRDVERQRRQEMSSLYTELRSLLPPEYIKFQGKRSISDHMDEATNYIKHLEKKIKELNNKRDQLKRHCSSITGDVKRRRPSSPSPNCVSVRQCCVGIEVIVGTEQLISNVLQVLVEEGLSVISCVSTKVSNASFHTIHSQVSDGKSVDLSGLQQKLIGLQ